MDTIESPSRGGHLKTTSKRLTTTVALLAFAGWSMAAVPIGSKLDSFTLRETRKPASETSVGLIVKTTGTLTSNQRKQFKDLRATVTREFKLIGAYAVQIPQRNISELASLPFVARVSFDGKMHKNDEFTVERSFADYAFERQGLTGRGVTVAVLDSGIASHPDLNDPATGKSRIVASVNFTPGGTSTADLCGHGTHVAGIVAGNGEQSNGANATRTFYGVARRANLVNVRVLDALGSTKVSTVISAIEWVVAKKDVYKIRVMNLSLGHPVGESYATDPLCLAVEKAWKAGIVVVVAAGNEGRSRLLALGDKSDNEGYGTSFGSVASPGNSPYVITVGAMKANDADRAHDLAATYSSRGPAKFDYVLKPDLMAPGNGVVSLRKPLSFLELTSPNNTVVPSSYMNRPGLLAQSDYTRLSGTSMATPVVAGAAALMLESNPALTPDTIKARLMLSADKWLSAGGNADPCTYGAGYLDIKGALASTFVAKASALSPCLVRSDSGDVTFDLDPKVQGERALWGSSLLDLSAVWGSRALWGSNTLNGSRALWGSSVWGNRAIWGSDVLSIGVGPILLNGE